MCTVCVQCLYGVYGACTVRVQCVQDLRIAAQTVCGGYIHNRIRQVRSGVIARPFDVDPVTLCNNQAKIKGA